MLTPQIVGDSSSQHIVFGIEKEEINVDQLEGMSSSGDEDGGDDTYEVTFDRDSNTPSL